MVSNSSGRIIPPYDSYSTSRYLGGLRYVGCQNWWLI
ncbi:hypothetical protein ALQ29_200065 [Pseudomonas marginalis pv. marginalis]|uniref:Uncharacterized protein n=1 Tax=Pseudomonas marginalis pv. marginalis TaxID=97473 RepID=A0A3M4ABB9_PSEMA|nr:hypothetical protein ALQ29_200065 [Pseudomonas marginalis pv. marginalis]